MILLDLGAAHPTLIKSYLILVSENEKPSAFSIEISFLLKESD